MHVVVYSSEQDGGGGWKLPRIPPASHDHSTTSPGLHLATMPGRWLPRSTMPGRKRALPKRVCSGWGLRGEGWVSSEQVKGFGSAFKEAADQERSGAMSGVPRQPQ